MSKTQRRHKNQPCLINRLIHLQAFLSVIVYGIVLRGIEVLLFKRQLPQFQYVVIAVLSPVAMAGNALVLAAIWRTASLRTPSYIILCGLVFNDFCTELVTQPFFVAFQLICQEEGSENNQISLLLFATAGTICGTFFTSLTLILITLMSIERWLHMTRRSWLTVRRSCFIVALVTDLQIPVALIPVAWSYFASSIIFFVFLLVSVTGTSVSYFKVFRIIRRHQKQVQANESSQNFGQPTIDLTKYKKSVFSILFILGIFYISYFPFLVITGLFILKDYTELDVAYMITLLFMSLSSSLNAVVYIWRMNDIRNGVKHLLKLFICMQ